MNDSWSPILMTNALSRCYRIFQATRKQKFDGNTHSHVTPFPIGHEDLQRSDGLREQSADRVEVGMSVKHYTIGLLGLLRREGIIDHVAQ